MSEISEHEVWQKRVKEVRDNYERIQRREKWLGWIHAPGRFLRWYVLAVAFLGEPHYSRPSRVQSEDVVMVGFLTAIALAVLGGIAFGLFCFFDWLCV